MLYHAYDFQRQFLGSASAMAQLGASWFSHPANPMAYLGLGAMASSALEVFAHAAAPRSKPEWGLETVEVDGVRHRLERQDVLDKPFGVLTRFAREGLAEEAPRVLIVAPMSGHYATLLRGTVHRMTENAQVYVTDWRDAREVPLREGRFDLDHYIDYLIEFLEHIGPGAHVIAVCQPSVPAFAATALMNEQGHHAAPASLTMMGGPIDTRQSPTSVNEMAVERPLSWFRQAAIATVPAGYKGAGRRVYPGFLQLAGFMSMNLSNHMLSHYELFKHLTIGDEENARATKDFYEEYLSTCDMTAEFYLQTVEEVFQTHAIPKGEFRHRASLVDPGAITRTALLAIEGERDDISGLGQTKAALALAANLAEDKKQYYLAEGAGHYGIFNGSKWRDSIAPVVEQFIARHSHR